MGDNYDFPPDFALLNAQLNAQLTTELREKLGQMVDPRLVRNEAIRARYGVVIRANGGFRESAFEQLAEDFGLSSRQIRRIVG